MGNYTAITVAGSHGYLQLNTFKPVMIFNLLQSIDLLADAAQSFAIRYVDGIRANEGQIAGTRGRSLMLVTALTPHIGYDKAAKIDKPAIDGNQSPRDAAIQSGHVAELEFDLWVSPKDIIKPSRSGRGK